MPTTEVMGGGTIVQLEGLNTCCVSLIQSLSAASLKGQQLRGMTAPADGQSVFCQECGETLVFVYGAWRGKGYMSDTFQD